MSGFDEKRLSTARAQLALEGFTATELDEDYGPAVVVTRWHLTRIFDSLDDLEKFVKVVRGEPA